MKIIVIGGKGTAIDIADQILDARENFDENIEFLGWAIDDTTLGHKINGFPVLCKPRELSNKFDFPDVKLLFSLYKPNKMAERVDLLSSYGISRSRFINFIHPLAYVARSVILGVGNVVLSHATLFSNVKIGDHNIIYADTTIGHDSRIGNNNFFASSNIGSECTVENGVFLGMNSTVKGGVSLSDYSVIGMGANVLENVESRQVVFGNPAKSRNPDKF